jgi:hypothetical protein
MIAGRSPLAVIYTALAFGIVAAPYNFTGVLMRVEEPLRTGLALALAVCTLTLVLRLVGWSKFDGWLARNTLARVSIQLLTVLALLFACLTTAFLAAGGGMAESLMWFYMVRAVGTGAIIAAVPVILLKPSKFERAFRLRLNDRLNPFRLATYAVLIVLAAFACLEAIHYYQVNHPVY